MSLSSKKMFPRDEPLLSLYEDNTNPLWVKVVSSVSCLDSSHVEWHWVIYQWYCHNIHLKRNIVPGIFFPCKQKIICNLHKCTHPSYFFPLKEVVVILKPLKNLRSLKFFESKLESTPEAKSLRFSKNSSVLLLFKGHTEEENSVISFPTTNPCPVISSPLHSPPQLCCKYEPRSPTWTQHWQ